MKLTSLILFSLLLHQHVSTLKVLAIIALPLRSHYMAFKELFDSLAARGHYVTVINSFPNEKPTRHMRFVNLKSGINNFSNLSSYETMNPDYLHISNFNRHLSVSDNMLKRECLNLLTNKDAKALLAEKVKYDVIFVEQFMSECELAYAAAFYDAPIIGITSHVMLPWSYSRMGIPFDYRTDAFYFSNAGPNPSLYGKLEAAVMNLIFNTFAKWNAQRSVVEAFEEQVPEYRLDIDKIGKERMRMMFVYQHHSITGARPMPPQVLEIAGLHIKNPKPLAQDLELFISNATSGAIYVSFGSNLKANTMTENKLKEFLKAFKSIPQKVIWKYENASLPDGNDNIYTSKWLPQLDILCHPKVTAFVSHGGMLSLSEAAYCGKPVLIIPFFGDQFSNGAAAAAKGIGKVLNFQHLNEETLPKAIADLTSVEMLTRAHAVHLQWQDRLVSVLDSAIYWTEYVARHKGAPPSLPARKLSWFESLHLDVYAVVIIIVCSLLTLLYIVGKCLLAMLKRSLSPQKKPKYL